MEALVLDIERVVGRRPDKQSSGPDTGGKQADVTRTDAYAITQAENGGIAGCAAAYCPDKGPNLRVRTAECGATSSAHYGHRLCPGRKEPGTTPRTISCRAVKRKDR